jgi:Protoglobin
MTQSHPTANESIPGYDYGTPRSAISPVSESELSQLEQTAGWTSDDVTVLAQHADLFQTKAESMVDSWRAVIGSQPHLSHWFVKPDGTPDDQYKASVKRRFVQWVVDVALRPHDRDWLNYQQEIGLRHIPEKKNKTDGAHTPPVVPFRYLLGFVPMVLPIGGFFSDAIKDEAELKRLQDAWTKAVLLHVTLWSRAYIADDLW